MPSSALVLNILAAFTLVAVRACVTFRNIGSYGRKFTQFGLSRPCDSVTLSTLTPSSRHRCAVTCSSETRCSAFYHSEALDRCSLLSSPCAAPSSSETARVMIKTPGGLTWRFNGSTYTVTPEKGSFNAMREACARYGMYLWIPDSQEEADFVYQKIFNNLTSPYRNADRNSYRYNFFIGVVDRPNGNCLLVDYATQCPIKNYASSQPNSGSEECTQVFKLNGNFMWIDSKCHLDNYGLCEGN